MPIPPGLDPDELNTDEELDSPHEGQQHGENHTRRPERGEALKLQGNKTRSRNREIAQGKR
jgi:hypothetical protein